MGGHCNGTRNRLQEYDGFSIGAGERQLFVGADSCYSGLFSTAMLGMVMWLLSLGDSTEWGGVVKWYVLESVRRRTVGSFCSS